MKFIGKCLLAAGLVGVVAPAFADKDAVKTKGQHARIVGGVEAEIGAWPFMTALVRRGNSANTGQFCGASYIGGSYALTASHCVDNATADILDVVIGIHDLRNESTEGERIAVSEIIMHESYSGITLDNDVAILVLENEPENAVPVNLITPEQMEQLETGNTLTVMGWGNRSSSGSDFPNVLHQVDVALYDQQQCNTDYNDQITETMVCAGFAEGGRDSCQGDSGGPLVVEINEEFYQVGVVSWGFGCAQPNAPGVYSRVSYFDSWFAGNLTGILLKQDNELDVVEQGFNSEIAFTVTNGPDSTLNLGSVTVVEAINMDSPTVVSDNCSGGSLAPDATCQIVVDVTANMGGNAGFTLSLTTDNLYVPELTRTANFNVIPAVTFDANSALDVVGMNWFTFSTLGWELGTSEDGEALLQSPEALEDNQASTLMTVINGPRTLTFDYLVSSELGYDFFEISVNGENVLSRSGDMTEFETYVLELDEGVNRIAFDYIKDFSISDYDDRAYLDKMVVSNTAPLVDIADVPSEVKRKTTVTLDASGSTDADGDALSFDWVQLSGPEVTLIQGAEGIVTFEAPSIKKAKTLEFEVSVTDQFGAVTKSSVSLKVKGTGSGGGLGWFLIGMIGAGLLVRRNR